MSFEKYFVGERERKWFLVRQNRETKNQASNREAVTNEKLEWTRKKNRKRENTKVKGTYYFEQCSNWSGWEKGVNKLESQCDNSKIRRPHVGYESNDDE